MSHYSDHITDHEGCADDGSDCVEREPEPSVVDRLRAMAAGEMAAAKHGTRVEKAVARAVARAYREAAEMIEEEA